MLDRAYWLVYFGPMELGEASSTGAPPLEGRSGPSEGYFWKA